MPYFPLIYLYIRIFSFFIYLCFILPMLFAFLCDLFCILPPTFFYVLYNRFVIYMILLLYIFLFIFCTMDMTNTTNITFRYLKSTCYAMIVTLFMNTTNIFTSFITFIAHFTQCCHYSIRFCHHKIRCHTCVIVINRILSHSDDLINSILISSSHESVHRPILDIVSYCFE